MFGPETRFVAFVARRARPAPAIRREIPTADMTNNLLQACWDGDLTRVRELIAQKGPECVNWPTDNSKTTPLFYAVKSDSRNAAGVARILLGSGADVNYVSDVDERGLGLDPRGPGARGRVRRPLHRGVGQGRRQRDRGLPGHRAAGHRPHPARRVAAGVAPAVREEVVEEGLLLLRRVIT